MFSWYKNAKVCIAYLEDVDHRDRDLEKAFRNNVWFTRAWTLQELPSPGKVEFFDYQCHAIGGREARAGLIEAATGVPSRFCFDKNCLSNTP